MLPRHKGSTLVVGAIVHILLFAVLTQVKAQPVRVRSAGTPSAGIATFGAQAVGSAGVAGAGQAGSAPVRLEGAGGNITLIKRVQPVYPAVMQAARMTGQVVLDAIINPDGTIGDVKVLSSTNAAFAQSAIAAVKQWRYSPLGFQGILRLSVNFTLT